VFIFLKVEVILDDVKKRIWRASLRLSGHAVDEGHLDAVIFALAGHNRQVLS
jgi:hypothetical protein